MAVVLPGKFIFLAHPHTGSSALMLALNRVFPDVLDLRPHHMSLADVHGKRGSERLAQYGKDPTIFTGNECVFTVVRNPYDAFVSNYVRRGDGYSFADFVRTYDEDPYVRDGKLFYHVPDAHNILRYENLDRELDKLMWSLGLPTFGLERINETEDKAPWCTYYTDKALEIFNQRFGGEIESYYPVVSHFPS